MAKLNLSKIWVEMLNVRELNDSPDELIYLGTHTHELITDWLTLHDENEAQRKLLMRIANMDFDTYDVIISAIRALIGGQDGKDK